MKTFLVLFTCSEGSPKHESWKKLTQQQQRQAIENGKRDLQVWESKYRSQVIFDGGHLSERTKRVDSNGSTEVPSQVGTFLVISAESLDEVTKMFFQHPHFYFFPGDGIEIIERTQAPRVEI